MPELPEARRKRMVGDYGITDQDAQVLTLTKSLADQFEEAAKAAKNPEARCQPGAERIVGPAEG